MAMRIAEVIGTVTLSRVHPLLARARWIIGVPFSLEALQRNAAPDGEDVVILDCLGAGNAHRIGFSEGVEAAMPFFPERKPVDAYCACILDQITIHDRPEGGDHETSAPVRER
jgi:microcompartment protein CcmK/EutM